MKIRGRVISMDFKFDEVEEESSQKVSNDATKKLSIIIIVVVSLVCGLTVFFITNALFGKKEVKEEPLSENVLNLNDDNVQILYSYVTYGTRGKRNEKFVKENSVTLESFTNEEKLYYAFQFVQAKDFISTGELDENRKKIYHLSADVVENYLKRFFGNKVTYSLSQPITYPFNFRINGQNIGIMTPTSTTGGYDAIFDGVEDNLETDLVEPFYTELVAAYQEVDGTYRLEEKVVYTKLEKNGDSYNVYLYKDYAKTMLIETMTNQTEEMLKQNPIQLTRYQDKASTIKYHFGLSNNMLYFESSEIVTN